MIDREKVIKALTECIFLHEHPDDDAGCLECPYRPDEKGTCPTMIPFLKDVLELLKEQEPVEPNGENCGECGYTLHRINYDGPDKELRHEWFRFCPSCGKAVKWDD